jgi:hypothetical protein
MNLTVCIAYCSKDIHLVPPLLAWMKELRRGIHDGPKYCCGCLLVADSVLPREKVVEINSLAKELFLHVSTIAANVPPEKQNWPAGANTMFHETAKQILECYKTPWLWLEPDAVPLRSDWLEKIAGEYELQPRRFMGNFITSDQPGLPATHMSGVAVYPADAFPAIRGYCNGSLAFDMAMAHYVVPRGTDTPLIQNHWGDTDLPPKFSDVATGEVNVVTLDFIRKDAVIFHRCKDGSLIELLRKNRDKPYEKKWVFNVRTTETGGPPPAKRKPGRPKKIKPQAVSPQESET